MTRIERLLGAPAGAEVERQVDLIVTDDWTTPALEAPLDALGTTAAAAPIVLVRDHTRDPDEYQGRDRERVVRLRAIESAFVGRFGAQAIIGRGIQHHVLPGSGRLRPGMLVLGNDSHTPTLGAYGVAAFAAQPATIAAAIHTGRLVLRVPETLRIRLVGGLRPEVTVRDASLALLDLLRDGGSYPRLATGKALEFRGPAISELSMAERAVLANVTPEAVAATATFPVDEATLASLGMPFEPVHEDLEEAEADLVLDLAAIVPALARSGDPADVVHLADFETTGVDRVFVGTCAGGTYEEIREFALALEGHAAVPTLVAPASVEVETRLRQDGIARRLEEAGVELLAPGCGPCFGFGVGRLEEGEVAVVTGNRNGIGRMGSPKALIHLASGRTAGVAARTGRLGVPTGIASNERAGHKARARIEWPSSGNVVRLHGTVSTDDLTPSSVPGVGASSDSDPMVLRRLLLHHLDPSAATRDLRGCVLVADENFGMGSNRASSVRALLQAGIRAVVARSFSPLYEMGARDEGLPVVRLQADEFYSAVGPASVVAIDSASGTVRLDGRPFRCTPASNYEQALERAGGVVPYLMSTQALVH